MKAKLALLAAAGSYAMISGAFAQESSGHYTALGAGVALGSDTNDLEADGGPAAFDSALDVDQNITIYGALGKYFNNGFRSEIELATRTQNIGEIAGDGAGFAGFPNNSDLGDISATTLMVNLFKTFDFDENDLVNPYIGAGVGVARMRPEYNNITVGQPALTQADMANSNLIVVADRDHTLALQGMAGLVFDFTEDMMLDVRYKYLTTGEFEYGGYVNGPLSELTGEYAVHEVTAGLRWNFGAAAPVAPVEPVVQYQTCFDGSRIPVTQECPADIDDEPMEMDPMIVYFDYDKSNLTEAAQTLIAARSEEALEGGVEGVTVSGNTDSAGSKAYNQALSARRAAVVRDALVANGIDSGIISTEALGESKPAKPTADGVKEPLNRRTVVQFSF